MFTGGKDLWKFSNGHEKIVGFAPRCSSPHSARRASGQGFKLLVSFNEARRGDTTKEDINHSYCDDLPVRGHATAHTTSHLKLTCRGTMGGARVRSVKKKRATEVSHYRCLRTSASIFEMWAMGSANLVTVG
ncbi:hypothetical protein GOP47_0026822 [Adiantum capillus-veneris]|nr:hypothetical protein GOP47_0026822 [Adiantum capillus-veneris]